VFTVKVKLIYIKLNKGEFNKTLIKNLEKLNREAARAWLKAVITRVPVWSGEARGSLRPLGQFLKEAIPINPSSSPGALRAMAAGHTAAAGEAQGSFEFKIEGGRRVVFIFNTQVVHYLINEYYPAPEPNNLITETPWYSFRAGRIAYDQYITQNLKTSIPRIKSYITRETGLNI
jgi:hypothetical protein